MIPFDKIYGWLFKSFNIGAEGKLVERLISQGYDKIMIVKRSWIFALYLIWIPFVLVALSMISIWIALSFDTIPSIKWTIVIGNVVMTSILFISTLLYIIHYREVYNDTDKIITDLDSLRTALKNGDRYFTTFFNWSLTNQWLLIGIMILELILIISEFSRLGEHVMFISIDFVIIIAEIYLLNKYRKRMVDLEMDFNVVVQGKIFFINQTGILSDTQTMESDKIKTIKSSFPNKLASFFNFGTVTILTEGDSQAIGELSMYYVNNPVNVVNSIQVLLGEVRSIPPALRTVMKGNDVVTVITHEPTEKTHQSGSSDTTTHEENEGENINTISTLHAMDTRGKVRDILR